MTFVTQQKRLQSADVLNSNPRGKLPEVNECSHPGFDDTVAPSQTLKSDLSVIESILLKCR